MNEDRLPSEEKARKSDALKEFEEMENEGRFAGGDAEAQQARAQAERKVQISEGSRPSQWGNREVIPEDAPPPLDGSQPNNEGSEAQNVSYTRDENDTISDDEVQHAINKANQGEQ